VYQDYQHQGTKAGDKAQGDGPYGDRYDGYEIALWKGTTSLITRET
jgi:hypothetical protein